MCACRLPWMARCGPSLLPDLDETAVSLLLLWRMVTLMIGLGFEGQGEHQGRREGGRKEHKLHYLF